MKKTIPFLSLIFLGSVLFSQTQDSVILGSGYANQAYYSLANGVQNKVVKDDWDIAFETTPQGYSILINAATGTELFEYPGDTTDFTSLDTSGISGWDQRFNSDTSWSYGAFSQEQSGFDVGWGQYNLITHNIIGDRIFVIKLGNGDFQKIWIKDLIGGIYTFRHATLNNSLDMTHTMDKTNFTGKNFGYYSLQNHGHVDKELLAEEWDLFFGQYMDLSIPYLVTGVLQKAGVKAVKVYPVNDPSTYVDFDIHTYQTEINSIGSDWKTFNMQTFTYDIADSTVYFVETVDGDIWKLIFTGFGGSADGTFHFTKELLVQSGIEAQKQIEYFEMYPNPASDQLTLNFKSNSDTRVQISDLSGRIVRNERIARNSMQHLLNVGELESGIYILSLISGSEINAKKLIIK